MKSTRYFEWLEGDLRGTVTTLADIQKDGEDTMYVFSDGEEIISDYVAPMGATLADLKGKIMVEVESTSNTWKFNEVKNKRVDLGNGQFENVPPLGDILKGALNQKDFEINDSDVGKFKLEQPKLTKRPIDLPKYEDWHKEDNPKAVVKEEPKKEEVKKEEPITEIKEPEVVETVHQPSRQDIWQVNTVSVDLNHPVSILVNKSKKHKQEIEISLEMMLPSKQLFEIASSEFDDGADVFIDNIIKDLDLNTIINSLKSALLDGYCNNPEPVYINPDEATID